QQTFSLGQGKGQSLWTSNTSLSQARSSEILVHSKPPTETPVAPAVTAPTPSLLPRSVLFKRQPDSISEIVEMDEDEEEDPIEDPEEAPQDAEVEAEEDPEEDLAEESAAEEVPLEEDDFADYWALVDSDSEDATRDDPHF
ncbi:hypothetical protein PIB30_098608, partial [Stylosanthes scabra]|nr:hypothetical protein [Stylosanthes scabra]